MISRATWKHALRRLLLVWSLTAVGSLPYAGCSPATSTSGYVSAEKPDPSAASGKELIEDTWDTYSMQGARVGYGHTTVVRVRDGGEERLRTTSLIHTSLQRGAQTVTQEMTLTSWDKPDGSLVKFESRMSAGPADIVSAGRVEGAKLIIDTKTLGRTESQQIDWSADWGGLFAPEQSFRRQPMKPGEKRTVRSLLPVFNLPADTRLEAIDFEAVELPATQARSVSEGSGRGEQLLKIRSITDIGAQKIETLLWVNDGGEVLKSLVPSIGQEAVRTTKEDALRKADGKSYDLLFASTVPLKGKLADPQRAERAVYHARMSDGSIEGVFANCLSQQVKPIDNHEAQLTIIAVRPDHPRNLDQTQPPPTEADRTPNNFIQSDDPQIAAMAKSVASDENDYWKIACALESLVRAKVRNKTFSQAFATAAEVARTLEGDCTEHGVLLAAVCRSRGIPARVAFGLVYYPPAKGFAYHMWNEAWITDRWVPLDATMALGGIGADHIKLGDSNLAGGSPLADLLSVIQVFGRLEIEVLEAE